jgi:methyl-accepting chemotaxis protein
MSQPEEAPVAGDRPAEGVVESTERQSLSLLRQILLRRKFLINRQTQLRSALLVTGVVFALLVLLNLTFHALRVTESRGMMAISPDVAQAVGDVDRNELILSLVGSLVLVLGVFAVTIFETHRTAGAAVGITRRLRQVADGDLNAWLALRSGDSLRDLEQPFNEMVGALRDRAASQADELERLAAQIGGDSSVGNQLRDLAQQMRPTERES